MWDHMITTWVSKIWIWSSLDYEIVCTVLIAINQCCHRIALQILIFNCNRLSDNFSHKPFQDTDKCFNTLCLEKQAEKHKSRSSKRWNGCWWGWWLWWCVWCFVWCCVVMFSLQWGTIGMFLSNFNLFKIRYLFL